MIDRLIELLQKADKRCDDTKRCEDCIGFGKDGECVNYNIADYLLENGVIVPPVKVGQTVYSKKCNAYVVEGIHYKNGRFMFGGNRESKEGFPQSVWYERDIGKTVFLTKEEAEKALAERSENEHSTDN